MAFWRRLIGRERTIQPGTGRSSAEAPPASVSGHEIAPSANVAPSSRPSSSRTTSFANQLQDAVHSRPSDWKLFRSHAFSHQQLDAMSTGGSGNVVLECLPFEFHYPASWSIRPDPGDKKERLAIRRIVVPDAAIELTEQNEQVLSPAFQLIGASTPSPTADALFDHWERPNAGAGFRDYSVLESERIMLNGDQLLVRVFDFTRTTGRWRSLMTLRWGNGCFYFFDVSGLVEHVEANRSRLVPVLATLRWYKSLRSFVNASDQRR